MGVNSTFSGTHAQSAPRVDGDASTHAALALGTVPWSRELDWLSAVVQAKVRGGAGAAS